MRYHHNHPADNAKGFPPFLTFNNPIFKTQLARVIKDQHGSLKIDAVLFQVAAILCFMPFEAH